jgi:hypothetical protein
VNLVSQDLVVTLVNQVQQVDAVLKEDQVLKNLLLGNKEDQVLEELKVLADLTDQEEFQVDKVYQVFQDGQVWTDDVVNVDHQVTVVSQVQPVTQVTPVVQVKMHKTVKRANKVHKVLHKRLVSLLLGIRKILNRQIVHPVLNNSGQGLV